MKMYGISNCDTVRKARKFLEGQGAEFIFQDFRKDGLSADEIKEWLQKADFSQIVNKRSTSWRALDDAQKAQLIAENASDEALQLLVEQPTLIKRPVLTTNNCVLFGFKEADYKKVLND